MSTAKRSTKRSARRGRPSKAADAKRNIKLQVYLNEEELRELKRILNRSGFEALSPFVRHLIGNRGEMPIIDPKVFIKQMGMYKNAVDHIGNNFNQIAKGINESRKIGQPISENLLAALRPVIDKYIASNEAVAEACRNLYQKIAR